MTTTTVPNLRGITLEGIPLDPTNLGIECPETRESILEDLIKMSKCKRKFVKIRNSERRGKHGPVRQFSKDEIKQIEFERMLKMVKKRRSDRTMVALAFLFDQTYGTEKWIGTEELSIHLEVPKTTSSSVMTAIDRKMGDLLERKFDEKKILRRVKDDIPFDNAKEFVEEYYRRDERKKKKVRPVKPRMKPKPTKVTKQPRSKDLMRGALMYLYAKSKLEGDEAWAVTEDVAGTLGISKRSASSLLSRIDNRMRDLLVIENIGVGGARRLRRKVEFGKELFSSPSDFAEEFYTRGPKFDKPKVEVPKVEPKPEEVVDDTERKLKELEAEVKKGVEDVAEGITKAIADILNSVDRRFDLNLNVSGEIKFRFLFGESK